MLSGLDAHGLTTDTPAASGLFVTTGGTVETYSYADDAWTQEASGVSLPGGYAYGAILDGHLYVIGGSSGNNGVYDYTIADKDATFTAITDMPDTEDSQTAVDDDGILWSFSTSTTQLVKYDLANEELTTYDGPADSPSSEPRVAWDAATKMIDLGDYDGSKLFGFDPATEEFTPLADFPDQSGMNDAFCSDNRGHVFTSVSDGADGVVWAYTAATDSWSKIKPLPHSLGSSGSCTVHGNDLYMLGYYEDADENDVPFLARLEVN